MILIHYIFHIPSYSLVKVRDYCAGIYSINLSKHYFNHRTKNWKLFKHDKYPYSIKITGIVSRFSKLNTNSNNNESKNVQL